MAYLGSWAIDDYVTFYCNTHRADTGAATDADAVPTYRVYEDETAVPLLTGNMALLDAVNTAGFYSERFQLLAVTGFEQGRQYGVYISATVNGVEGTVHHTFQVGAEVATASIAAAVWSYVTRTLTSFGTLAADIVAAILASSLAGDIVAALMAIAPVAKAFRTVDLELYRGDTWTQPVPRLGNIAGRAKLWIACKEDKTDADAQAVFKIEETAGLEVIDGAAATVPGNGSIVVTDAAIGNITVTLAAVETAKLDATKKYWYDVQVLVGAVVTTLRAGRLMITSDVVRETS